MGIKTRRRTTLVVVVLGAAVALSLLFVQFLGEPTTERVRPRAAEPTSTPLPAVEQPLPTPTPVTVPSGDLFNLPDGSSCTSVPGDREIGDTVFVDLDGDGDSDAIGPQIRLELGGVVEFGIFLAVEDCQWTPIGLLSEGPARDANHNIIDYSWSCSYGTRNGQPFTNLVQLATQSFPAAATSITQYSIIDSELVEHVPTLIDDRHPIKDRAVACDRTQWFGELTVETKQCGGRGWRVDIPEGWLTTPVGGQSCQWFTPSRMTVPCQCDAIPEIQITLGSFAGEPDQGLSTNTVIDGYPARVSHVLGEPGMGGLLVNRRTYLIDVGGGERLALSANNLDSQLSWEELSAQLDLFAQAIDITGWPAPTVEMFYPEFPNLDPQPFHLDPAGTFALYRLTDSPQRRDCSDPEPSFIARLTITASRSDDLQFTRVGPLPAGRPEAVHYLDDGSTVLTFACRTDADLALYMQQPIVLEPNGSIVTFGTSSPTELIPGEADLEWQSASSPDGQHRYFSGDDPQGRRDYGCGNGSRTNPSVAKTMLRSSFGPPVPAFPDGGRTGQIRNMRISDSGFAVWESHSCQSVGLHLGRLSDDGSIVDRHLIAAQGIVNQTWTITDADELIILTPRYKGPGYPALRRIDMAASAGWVITADPPLRIDTEPIATSFSGEGSWRLGENRVVNSQCPGDTIYADEPGGQRRVSDYLRDIEGDVVDIMTSEILEMRPDEPIFDERIVVALAECPSQHEGLTLWFASEFSNTRVLRFQQADIRPIRRVHSVSFGDEWPHARLASVEYLDGTSAVIELRRP